jgi:hypothetical protein
MSHPLEELREQLKSQQVAVFLFDDHPREDVYGAVTVADIERVLDTFIKAHPRLMDADDIRLDDLHRCGFRVRLCAIPETECPDQRVAEAGDGV